MSELCEFYCPSYYACKMAIASNAAARESLQDQCAHLEANMALFTLLDQDEEVLQQLRANRTELARNTAIADQLEAARLQIAEEFEACDGPTLGLIRNALFRYRHRSRPGNKQSLREIMHETEDKELDRRMMLMKYGHCARKAARAAAAHLPSQPG